MIDYPEAPRSRLRRIADTGHAEVRKLVTLPAVYLTVPALWAVTVLLEIAVVAAVGRGRSGSGAGLGALAYVQAGFVVLGVLAATSEYHGGQLRTTLTAVPRRLELQAVRAFVVAAAGALTAAGTVVAAVLIAESAPTGTVRPVGMARAVEAVACLALTTVLATCVATVLRRTLPAVAVLLGYFYLAGPYLRAHTTYAGFLPDAAGYRLWSGEPPAAGWISLTAWTLAAFASAAATLRSRDS
jgi:ABC-2 type transport system permease protein